MYLKIPKDVTNAARPSLQYIIHSSIYLLSFVAMNVAPVVDMVLNLQHSLTVIC